VHLTSPTCSLGQVLGHHRVFWLERVRTGGLLRWVGVVITCHGPPGPDVLLRLCAEASSRQLVALHTAWAGFWDTTAGCCGRDAGRDAARMDGISGGGVQVAACSQHHQPLQCLNSAAAPAPLFTSYMHASIRAGAWTPCRPPCPCMCKPSHFASDIPQVPPPPTHTHTSPAPPPLLEMRR
jgi:hypothetical protein